MDDRTEQALTCIDSEVGERILELSSPALDNQGRRLLEAHAEACGSCRLTLDLERRLAEGIRDGSLAARRTGSRRPRWLGWSSAAAMAASLVFLMVLPPRPVGPSFAQRGPGGSRFLQPVEGEVVGGGDLRITWTKVVGARSYGVRVAGVESDYNWIGSTSDTQIRVPKEAGLPRNESLRVLLTTTPTDLLPPGSVSVTYRIGNTLAATLHRARHAQSIVYMLWLLGFGLGATYIWTRHA